MREYDEWKKRESMEWLRHVRGLSLDMLRMSESYDDTVEVIRRLAEPRGIDYARPAVSTSRNVDAMADVVAAMVELEEAWRDSKVAVAQELKEAKEVVDRLPDARHRAAVTLYYLDHARTWAEVADKMGYEESSVYDILDGAAVALHDLLPPEWRTRIPSSE
ncbi:MAG: sigma-70 family RNA polymerase sigma factor [Eggerthellaceae bacterium]|nr:sigma-70 family RNA polymerase sigma factor [Eggerthellaceae bacterium]